jgi:hypothetical protein
MKARLILVFAVFVTTATARDVIRMETSGSSNEDESNVAYNNYELGNDKNELEQCSGKTKGVFSFYDYSVVLAMLVVSLKIGLFYGFFDKSSSHLEHSERPSMGLFPVTLSLATSFVTAIELLGNPAEMFFYGTQYSIIGECEI